LIQNLSENLSAPALTEPETDKGHVCHGGTVARRAKARRQTPWRPTSRLSRACPRPMPGEPWISWSLPPAR